MTWRGSLLVLSVFNLIQSTGETFNWVFYLIFFSEFLSLLNSSFLFYIVFIHGVYSGVCLHPLQFHYKSFNHLFWIFWDFIHFSIISFCYCGVVEFWTIQVTLVFGISCVSVLGFVPLRPNSWLEVLITCSISVDVQAGQCSGWVEVVFLTSRLVVWINSPVSDHGSGDKACHQHCSAQTNWSLL
jgi:hypothetical protein